MVLDDLWVRHVGPIITPDGPLVWRPAGEAMHKDDGVLVRPFRHRQMVIPTVPVTGLGRLAIKSGSFPVVQVLQQFVNKLNHECEN